MLTLKTSTSPFTHERIALAGTHLEKNISKEIISWLKIFVYFNFVAKRPLRNYFTTENIPIYGNNNRYNAADKDKLIGMLGNCDSLKALEIKKIQCPDVNDLLFSHFPSLVYVRLSQFNWGNTAFSQFNCNTAFEYTITNCHHLKHLYYEIDELLTLPSSSNSCLRQLCIKSDADLSAPSVQVLSAHGGLEQVMLFVKSITTSAITTLINNSPSLILLCVVVDGEPGVYDGNDADAIVFLKDYKDTISKKFSNRKLPG